MVWINNRIKKTVNISNNHNYSINEEKINKKEYIYGSEYQNLKSRIHDKLLNSIDLSILESLDQHVLRQEISHLADPGT